jgi:epoxyqueuosine reductase
VGFAACGPLAEERERLDKWLAAGLNGPLGYLSPEAAAGHIEAFPAAKTAVAAFFPYVRPESVPGAAPGSLKLSRYLWGPDYHLAIKGRLAELLLRVQGLFPGAGGRDCAGAAPMMEKRLAVRAGLGRQGKNTLLIADGQGSWGFLGVLLLDIELEPDRPLEGDACGACTRCIDACPTGALSPFVLDCSRCISTWTIEREGPPADVAGAIARTGWVAGCDVCQEACPWNEAPTWGDPKLWGGPGALHAKPAAELRMAPARWKKATAGTALRRVRHRHWNATLDTAAGG